MKHIPQIITNPLDNDVYKWSMSNFLYKQGLLRERVGWKFFNRDGVRFPIGYGEALKAQIDTWKGLTFTDEQLSWFEKSLYWLDYYYIWAYLKIYRFETDCIKVVVTNCGDYEDIDISYEGEWGKVIFFEIFLLSTMTELYNIMTYAEAQTLPGAMRLERNTRKFHSLAECGAKISEFGTRRRYSMQVQEATIAQMLRETPDMITGTSNAMFAKQFNILPVGTMGHELVMFMGAKFGPLMADSVLMRLWVDVYRGALGIYLPDTYTTKHFLEGFDLFNSKLWDGVREDSAPDTDAFVDSIIEHYRRLKVDPSTKTIVHSNGINSVGSVAHMQNYRKGEIRRTFGIGTWLTNDIYTEKPERPLDWVIKMTHTYDEVGRKHYCVKISDMTEKVTSADDPTTQAYLRELGIS